MVTKEAIGPRVKGKARVQLLRLHRLLEFERAFTSCLEGKTDTNHVAVRAKKMLEIGLLRLK